MRRLLLLIVPTLALLGALETPGRAAPAGWEDPAGDATAVWVEQVELGESSPRPSDPELDIRNVSLAVEGDSIVASASMEAGGFAVGSGGSVWRFYFGHKDNRYFFQALAATAEYSQVFTSTPRFYRVTPDDPDPTSNGEELRCDCKMTIDLDGGKVRFAIKTESVAKTLRTSVGSLELKELDLRTYRRVQF